MTTQDLYRTLGEPSQSVTGNNGRWASYSWPGLTAYLDLPAGKVSTIIASSALYALSGGIKVGSSELALSANYPNPASTKVNNPMSKSFCYASGMGVDLQADANYSEKVSAIHVWSPGCSLSGTYVCFESVGGRIHPLRECRRQ